MIVKQIKIKNEIILSMNVSIKYWYYTAVKCIYTIYYNN